MLTKKIVKVASLKGRTNAILERFKYAGFSYFEMNLLEASVLSFVVAAATTAMFAAHNYLKSKKPKYAKLGLLLLALVAIVFIFWTANAMQGLYGGHCDPIAC